MRLCNVPGSADLIAQYALEVPLLTRVLLGKHLEVVRVVLFGRHREICKDPVTAVLEVSTRDNVPGQDLAALAAEGVLDAVAVQRDGKDVREHDVENNIFVHQDAAGLVLVDSRQILNRGNKTLTAGLNI